MHAISLLFHDVYVADPRESGFGSRAADRYKLPVADIEAQLAGLADACSAPPVLITERGARVAGRRPDVLITVDDGGVSYYTLLADRLEARGWRGHCFVSTDAIGRPGFLDVVQIRELDARGHLIGSHSASHPARFSACGVDRMRGEWVRSRQVLEDILGHAVTTASVPGGYYSRQVAQTAREAGLQVLFTSEPTTAARDEDGILVAGRFTIRRGHPADTARRLVEPTPWTRAVEWASWNAKAVVKPLLGPSYARVADWILGHG